MNTSRVLRRVATALCRSAAPLSLVLLLGAAPAAHAQERHTVRIEDGVVYVDGDRVPESELPASLRTEDLQLNFEFTGPARFHLDGNRYGIENGRLVQLPVDDDRMVVFYRDGAGQVMEVPRDRGTVHRFRLDGPVNGTIGTYLEVLDDHAEQFEKLSAQLADSRLEDRSDVAAQLRSKAEEAAIMVRAFPRVEVQTYLEGLQFRDQTLYERLLREQRMDVSSADLARRVFSTTDPDRRRSLTGTLRDQLEQIFELKQQNRRDEITQLEMQLRELREQLEARERNRELIIGNRLEALVGPQNR